MSRPTIAARAARWSADHARRATLGWLLVVVAAVALGTAFGTRTLTDVEQSNGETARAEQILADAHIDEPATEGVLVQSRGLDPGGAERQAAVRDVERTLAHRPEVAAVHAPVASKDGRSSLVQFDLAGPSGDASAHVKPVADAVAAVQRTHPRATVAEFGGASADKAVNDGVGRDFASAERMTVPVTFLILLLAFGAVVAAGVPVLLALSAVLGSVGLSALVSHVFHASQNTASMILLMGMAVGVDYSLFYVKREREERAAGHGGREALHRAAATSGRAVLVSGVTVMIAMAGMLLAGSKIYTSLAIGAMIVVAMSVVGSLTVLPAVLGKLGDSIDRGAIGVLAATLMRIFRRQPRFLRWLRDRRTLLQVLKGGRSRDSRFWGFVVRRALRRPVAAVVGSTAVLLALALPALGMHLTMPGFADVPQGTAVAKAHAATQRAFPGASSPATVVVRAPDVTAPAIRSALADLRTRALATGDMSDPIRTTVSRDRTVAEVKVPLAGSGEDAASNAALDALRTDVIPASLGRVGGVEYAVTGQTAGDHDFIASVRSRAPLVFAFVLGLAFLVLLVTFRSIVVPLKAIVLNLLSVGAAYGVLVWVFQRGLLHGAFGLQDDHGVIAWLPLFLFTVLFGLSMDYHVFVLSRVRELVDRGLPTPVAVEQGVRQTAGTVTSAAVVMVAVFAIFASLSSPDLQQMGAGLAAAVLIDATIIRGVLLPATMVLLGERNWYLPRVLRWLPRIEHEPAPRIGVARSELS